MSVRKGNQVIAGTPRTTGGVEIGDIGFAPLGIDESLNLRRYLNGQVISQSQFTSFTNKLKAAVALFPSLATTETNWQAEKTNSKLGQCGKFVVDDTAGTIRLPCVVNAQGLLSLSGIGNLVNESLPNITGKTSAIATLTRTGEAQGALYDADGVVSGVGAPSGSTYGGIRWSFDASRSSSTYQDNAPVQQEAVQYPYYIQVATGIEETLPAIREYNINTPHFFGQSMYSDVAPDNASWLVSNGQYNAKTIYPDMWTQLQVELNSSLNKGDTAVIDGKTYVKRGLPVVLSTATYTDYDWVVNTADETFRLPLLNGSEDLPSNRYDDLTLTSTAQRFTAPANGIYTVSGVGFGWVDIANETSIGFGSCSQPRTSDGFGRYTLKAKRGDQIVVFCGAVPSSYTCRFIYAKGNGTLYFYVGDTVQDASLINAGAVLGQLANKADINASNFNADGKSLLSGLSCMSNGVLISQSFATSTTFTAPDNGWFKFRGVSTASPSRCFMANTSVQGTPAVGGDTPASGALHNIVLRVKKGDKVSFQYINLNIAYDDTSGAWFYPDVGEV